MRARTVASSLLFALLPSAFAFASRKEVAPVACWVVLADRQALSWLGGGEGRTWRIASQKAIHNTCDGLPANERTLCRKQAPMGKWEATVRKSGDPAHPRRASYRHYVSVEILKPRSQIRAVGHTVAFLTARPIEGGEDYARACRRAIHQACRLLGTDVAPDFPRPDGDASSTPCAGADWRLAERTLGRPTDAEGASFNPDAMSKARVANVPLLPKRGRPSAPRALGRSARGGN